MTPLGNKVIVRPTPPKRESAGGIVFAEVHEERSAMSGTVLSVGHGPASAHAVRRATVAACVRKVRQSSSVAESVAALEAYAAELPSCSEVKPGDFVTFPFTAGSNLTVDGDTVIVLHEDSLESVWTPDLKEVA